MRREQKTEKSGWPCNRTVEPESNKGARSITGLETEEGDGASTLLERVLDRDNLNQAYKRVKQNGGASGVDGMTVHKLLPYLQEHRDELLSSIRGGWYKPKPVRRVEIPKDGGGVRKLGVPTVIDRLVQQAIARVLQPIFEEAFSGSSYGFRPGRSGHQAMKQAKEYYEQGYKQVVDIDLAKYFDTVSHDMLIGMVRERVKDERVIKLIRRILKSGVMVDGIVSPTKEGTPQGGNLSPLLSNIYLTKFDRMLESRGHKFVRYADDCNIYVKSKRAAVRVMESSTKYLENKLKLRVNREKSQIGSPTRLKFLGFSMYNIKGKTGIRPHEKSVKRFKERVRELTSRKQAKPVEQILKELKTYTTGWLGYYAIADMKDRMKTLNEWLRRRIRQIHWKQWKSAQAKYRNLVRLGTDTGHARQWANTGRGYWRIAGSWVLTTSLTNKYLASIGYDDIYQRYEAMHLTH